MANYGALKTVSEREREVLKVLVASMYDGEPAVMYFHLIANELKLEIPQVRRACRGLKRKGYADYVRGLMNEDGVAGSGYCATISGVQLIKLDGKGI